MQWHKIIKEVEQGGGQFSKDQIMYFSLSITIIFPLGLACFTFSDSLILLRISQSLLRCYSSCNIAEWPRTTFTKCQISVFNLFFLSYYLNTQVIYFPNYLRGWFYPLLHVQLHLTNFRQQFSQHFTVRSTPLPMGFVLLLQYLMIAHCFFFTKYLPLSK